MLQRQTDIEWTALFHKVVDDILAPRGFEDHHSGKKVAKLEFLTEDRIKKVANATKRVLDLYRNRLKANMETAIHNIAMENEKILIDLENEKSKWFFKRRTSKIIALERRHHANSVMVKLIPKVIETITTTSPH